MGLLKRATPGQGSSLVGFGDASRTSVWIGDVRHGQRQVLVIHSHLRGMGWGRLVTGGGAGWRFKFPDADATKKAYQVLCNLVNKIE